MILLPCAFAVQNKSTLFSLSRIVALFCLLSSSINELNGYFCDRNKKTVIFEILSWSDQRLLHTIQTRDLLKQMSKFLSASGGIIVWIFLSLTVTALWHLNRHFCVTSKWLDEAFVSILMNLLLTFCLKTMAKQSPTMLCKCKCKCNCKWKWKVVSDFCFGHHKCHFSYPQNRKICPILRFWGYQKPSFGCSTSGAPLRRDGVKLTLLHLLICGAPSCTVPLRWSRPVSW